MNNCVIIAALVFLLHQQFVASQDICDPNPCMNGGTCTTIGSDYSCTCNIGYSGQNCTRPPTDIRIQCPGQTTIGAEGIFTINNPTQFFDIRMDVTVTNITYTYVSTQGRREVSFGLNEPNVLTDFSAGNTTQVAVSIRNINEFASCTFTVGPAGIVCPQDSTGLSAQFGFPRPEVSNFLNADTNVQITYTYNSNSEMYPYNQQTHFLTNLPLGCSVITATAQDTDGNSAVCTFQHCRTGPIGIVCPQNSSGLSAQHSFDRPLVMNFQNPESITITYTYNVNTEMYLYNQPMHALANVPFGCSDIRAYAVDMDGNDDTCVFQRCREEVRCPMDVREVTCDSGYAVSFAPATTGNVPASITYTVSGSAINFNTANPDQVIALFPLGSRTVRATARDSDGQTDYCEFNVLIIGNDNPAAITCAADVSRQISCTESSASVGFQAFAVDDCGRAVAVLYQVQGSTNVISTPQTNAIFNVGVSTVIATATYRGQSISCNSTVTVIQDRALICPQDIDLRVPCGIVSYPVDLQVSSDCGNVGNIEYTSSGSTDIRTQGNSFLRVLLNLGLTTITATDMNGNTCQTHVTIYAEGDPLLSCEDPIYRQVPCGTTRTLIHFQAVVCGELIVSYTSRGDTIFDPVTQNQGSSMMNVGTSFITATASDSSGRPVSIPRPCSTVVTVAQVDTFPPAIFCAPTINRQLPCLSSAEPIIFAAHVNDDCDYYTITYSSQGATRFDHQMQPSAIMNNGISIVTAIATDGSNKTSTCNTIINITRDDTRPPSVTCNNISVQLPCDETSTRVDFKAEGLDDCSPVTFSYISRGATVFEPREESFAQMNVGVSYVTARATDGRNSANCTSIVNVTGFGPSITCGVQNIKKEVPCGATTTNFLVDEFRVFTPSECGPVIIYYTSTGATSFTGQTQGAVNFNLGVSNITATAIDGNGQTDFCNTLVNVTEVNNPPIISCAADINLEIQCASSPTLVNFAANATDDCGPNAVTVSYWSTSPATIFGPTTQPTANLNLGVTTINVLAQDINNQVTSCDTQVTIVEGDTPPTISCTRDISLEVPCGIASTEVAFPATAVDDCRVVFVTYISSGATTLESTSQYRAQLNVGNSIITATARDRNNMTSSCSTRVSLIEVGEARIQCPSYETRSICNGQSYLNISWPEAIVMDDTCVDIASIAYVGSGATNFPSQSYRSADMYVGMTTITASATDTRGQITTCGFDVVVNSMDPCANHRCQNGGQCEVFPGSCLYSCVCPPCFYGQFCEKRLDACSCHKCQNGAMCQANSCTQYQCMCVGCYTGQLCQHLLPDPCLRNPCGGYRCTRDPGSCTGYNCECIDGINCPSERLVYEKLCNTFPCQNGGTCTDLESDRYMCICQPGYGGVNCATAASFATSACNNRPCNFGECFTSYDMENIGGLNEYTCLCANGYGGRNCISSVANNPFLDMCTMGLTCRNGGTCTNAYFSYAERNAAICSCPRGYFGRECQLTINDPCMSNPCQNAGTCTSFNTYFLCTCAPNYTGVICEVNPCQSRPCQNGGTCTSVGANYMCTCTSPYSGLTCEIPIPVNPCQSGPCQNGGTCTSVGTNYICTCTSQYSGPTCEIQTQPPLRLICPTNQAVQAQLGQPGATVFYREGLVMGGSPPYNIEYNPSGNYFPIGVTRVTVTASDINNSMGSCTFTVTVSSSQDPCFSNPCRNRATCINGGNRYFCRCVPGWTGIQCEIDINECASFPCLNSGTCINDINQFSCRCLPGFTGFRCESNIDECISDPCRNGGTCTDGVNQFSCLCVAGYTGSTCQTPLTGTDLCTPRPCLNGGYCMLYNEGRDYYCICINGYAGSRCETLDDTQPPWPLCPANQNRTINNDGTSFITVDFPRAVATDNSGRDVTIVYSNEPGSFFPIGTTVVNATATDFAGNSAMCVFAVTVNVAGRRVPTVSGCNSDSSQLVVDQHTVLSQPGQARLNWVEPASSPAGIPSRTHNGLRSDSLFPTGLTEIIYVFGSPGAEATCTYRVFVLESNRPCDSNPCIGEMRCYQNDLTYLCGPIDPRRKKRDTEDNQHCGPYCDLLGGICAGKNDLDDTFEPACFYPASAFTEDKHHVHSDPGSGEVIIEHNEHSEPGSGEVDYSQSFYSGYLFLYILLTIVCLVVCIQSFFVCRLVTKRIGGKFKSEKAVDEKDFY
ncbi:uncharacterized protein [Amphiura filiformis]|uniref:uncharacterized protein n=1 Tax=Amphiura filiformis TaxID=82378 RepID=UPI003B221D65